MDWQSIQPFFHWLADHPFLAGFFIFLIAFSESLLIVGLIVPGTVLMFGVGSLVGAGALDFWNTIIIAFFGAIAGDATSFLIGKHYHASIIKIWPFNKHPDYFDKGKHFFKKHGGISILVGRFVGPIRPVIPAVAGMMGMSQTYFLFVNVLSAAGWAPFYLIPGIVFGTSISLAAAIGTRLVILFLLVVTAVFFVAWLLKAIYFSVLPWFQKIFVIWYEHTTLSKTLLNFIFEEDIAKQRGALLSLILSIFLFVLMFSLLSLTNMFNLGTVDEITVRMARYVQWNELSKVLIKIDHLFSWVSILFLFINLFLLSVFYKQVMPLLRIIVVVIFSLLSIYLLYLLNGFFQENVAMDTASLLQQMRFVFILTTFFLLMVIIDEFFTKTLELVLINIVLLALLVLLLVNLYFSRLSLSTELLVISVTSISATVTLWGGKNLLSKGFAKSFSVSSVCFLLLFSGLNIPHIELESLMTNDDIAAKNTLSNNVWWSEEWKTLDSNRQGVFEESGYNFNVQWSGSLAEIQQTLKDSGWEVAEQIGLRNLLLWLSPESTLYELGEIPDSHHGQRRMLTLYKSLNKLKDERLRIQFWQSNMQSKDEVPNWLVELSHQSLGEPGILFDTIKTTQTKDLLIEFQKQMINDWESRIVYSKNIKEILLLKRSDR